MREAVIVSTARTPLTKAHRGEFNITPGATLAAFAVRAAVERSGVTCGFASPTPGATTAGPPEAVGSKATQPWSGK